MYIYEKSELAEHPMFQQAVILSEMTTGTKWRSIYRDESGELAVSFYDHLTKDQIKTVLMHFKDLLDGDTDVNNISCDYHIDYAYCTTSPAEGSKLFTQVYTPVGYDYSQF